MEEAVIQDKLGRLTPLSGLQYDKVKNNVKQAMLRELGKEPDRKSVSRDLGPLLGPEDWLAVAVFIAAFVVSAIHILSLIGRMAGDLTNTSGGDGVLITSSLFIKAHQLGFVALAEFAMILFMVRWRLWAKRREEKLTLKYGDAPRPRGSFLGSFLSIDMCLAMLAAGFTLHANLDSKLPLLESIMPPLFTIGIGIHLEHVFVETLERRKIMSRLLDEKITEWHLAVANVMASPGYKKLLVRSLWEAILQNPQNAWGADEPADFKWAAVQREFGREDWFEQRLKVADQVSPQALTAMTQSGWGLDGLLQAVISAGDGASDRLEIGPHWVDLATMTWYNGEKNRQYGPYKAKGNLVASMKLASRSS